MKKISIGIDTSGNTGKNLGTSGFCRIDSNPASPEFGFIKALPNEEESNYFKKIISFLETIYKECIEKDIKLIVTVEKYIEYGYGATKFSSPPTIELNRTIKNWAEQKPNITFRQKTASHLKSRWSDKVLISEQWDKLDTFKHRKTPPNTHMIDSGRACLDGWYFG